MKLRKCNKCHEWKNLSEYAKDSTKTGGYSYTCLECKRAYDRSRQKKRNTFNKQQRSVQNHMMTDVVFDLFYHDDNLREHIVRQSIRYSKHDREFQKDLQQVAWGRIAMCVPGKDIDFYKNHAERAIKTEWQRMWRIREYGLAGVETMTGEECLAWQRGYFG